MADKGTKGAKPSISYASLHNLCNIHTVKKTKPIRKAKEVFYEAERIIERRNRRDTKEYLVKWTGYPTWQFTWEPEDNLNESLLRSYNNPPQPDMVRIDECCLAFHTCVIQGLKSSSIDAHMYVPFRLDVWRFLTKARGKPANERGSYLCEKDDFDKFANLPNHWYYYLNEHGEGEAVNFPIKIWPFLSKTSAKDFVVGDNGIISPPILYNEKLSVYFVQRACNTNNI